MSPYGEIKKREEELGRPLTVREHIEIVERRMWMMRVRFYVIIVLLIVSVIGGTTATLWAYKKSQDYTNKQACLQANARWGVLRQNLITVALKRQPGETTKEFNMRSARTLALVQGLFNVDCNDPTKRIPAPETQH